MRKLALLLACAVVLTGCSGDSAKSDKAEPKAPTAANTPPTETARSRFNDLMRLIATDGQAWDADYKAATTEEERTALEADRPLARHAQKFLELGKSSDDPIVAQQALEFALSNGVGKVADSAGAAILETIKNSTDPEDAETNQELVLKVLRSTTGETRASAAKQLMAGAGDLETDESVAIVNQLLRSGVESEILADVTDRVLTLASREDAGTAIGSCLAGIAEHSQDPAKVDAAMELLTSRPTNRSAMLGLLNGFSRSPSQSAEDRLKSVCETLEGDSKAQALLAFSEYSKAVAGLRTRYAGKAGRVPPGYTELQKNYIAQETDGELQATVEGLMTGFIEANKDTGKHRAAVARITSDLFVMKNLSVGREAPEIAAADLDGTDFKLSDYRGKVVFLDFWGDW